MKSTSCGWYKTQNAMERYLCGGEGCAHLLPGVTQPLLMLAGWWWNNSISVTSCYFRWIKEESAWRGAMAGHPARCQHCPARRWGSSLDRQKYFQMIILASTSSWQKLSPRDDFPTENRRIMKIAKMVVMMSGFPILRNIWVKTKCSCALIS